MAVPAYRTLRKCLLECRYEDKCLRDSYPISTFSEDMSVGLAAFAHEPFDTRSACIAIVDALGDSSELVSKCRSLGAPVVFVLDRQGLQWWKHNGATPHLVEHIKNKSIPNFFRKKRDDFAPQRIYRAKTLGRVQKSRQLDFVDVGLIPMVESEAGQRLSGLVVDSLEQLVKGLHVKKTNVPKNKQLFQATFWLLAAKMLKDKGVKSFASVNLWDIDEVYERVARHYGASPPFLSRSEAWKEQLGAVGHTMSDFASLSNVSTEALGYVYENALIPEDLRKELGIHSTPTYLIDYMVWQLAPLIEQLPLAKIDVFEPSCGHAGFLVAMVRLLKDLTKDKPQAWRSRFLRKAVHGIDIDSFALEIARLSLTLADVPNRNGWDLREGDMFESPYLSEMASTANVLLINPPSAKFSSKQMAEYKGKGIDLEYELRELEVLERTLRYLPEEAVFGFVLPQGFLHSKQAKPLRKTLATDCEISEVCLFPDNMFSFSDSETTVIMGRKLREKGQLLSPLRHIRVRENETETFKQSYRTGSERFVNQNRFRQSPIFDMRLPELEEVWVACEHLDIAVSIAHIGQGLSYLGVGRLPADAVTISSKAFRGSISGFEKFDRKLSLHDLPEEKWLNATEDVLLAKRSGIGTGSAQILLNYAPVSRGPWRLKALLDTGGGAVTSNFICLRPRKADWPIEYLWALCNAPFANSYMYTHSSKRHNLVGTFRKMPVPSSTSQDVAGVVKLVKTYFDECETGGSEDACRETLLSIDAEILRLYDLPPKLERQLLDLFTGHRRKGVPFDFDGYYPPDFRPTIPYHLYRSKEYQRSTAGEQRRRYRPVESPTVLNALKLAAESHMGD